MAVVVGFATACSTAYYSAWEMLGKEKRDLLRSNVETVKKDQEKAADRFEDALERLRSLYEIDAGDLEKAYDKIKDDYEDAKNRAGDISDRIDTIDEIAEDLFSEWEKEIDEISTQTYRNKSRKQLEQTQEKYAALATSLRKAESSMDPVLTHLKDNVLFLKHNLNAAAIGGLSSEMDQIESDIEELIADMRASIAEADRFLSTLGS
jgi:predicted  nucleic acid-binding Zn-ribbon protein